MNVRKCRLTDIKRCSEIWRISFPDDADYCDYYFENVHPLGTAFVLEDNDDITSYLNILPFEASVKKNSIKNCKYIYGVCTDEKYRGKGYMNCLLNKALEFTDNDEFSFLIPSVHGLYEKYGYRQISQKREFKINIMGDDSDVCDDLQHLNSIYSEYCSNFDISLVRTEKWWEILYHTAVSDGYKIIANEGAYAIIKKNRLSELAYVSESYRDKLNIKNAVLCLPEVMARGNICFDNNYFSMLLE